MLMLPPPLLLLLLLLTGRAAGKWVPTFVLLLLLLLQAVYVRTVRNVLIQVQLPLLHAFLCCWCCLFIYLCVSPVPS